MKKYIDELVNRGLTYEEALTIVRSIAVNAFVEGADNKEYLDDGFGYHFNRTFGEWFEIEVNKL
jgi:hypothetical protein